MFFAEPSAEQGTCFETLEHLKCHPTIKLDISKQVSLVLDVLQDLFSWRSPETFVQYQLERPAEQTLSTHGVNTLRKCGILECTVYENNQTSLFNFY